MPAYLFTRDGSKLLSVLDGRLHVRAIDGDATADRLLDGANFVRCRRPRERHTLNERGSVR